MFQGSIEKFLEIMGPPATSLVCRGMVICKVWGLLANHFENLDGKKDLYFVLSQAIEGSYYAIELQHVVFVVLKMHLEKFPYSTQLFVGDKGRV